MKLLVISLILSRSVFAAQVPDYKVNVGLDPASKVPAWLLEFVPPPAHHFNLNAPMKVDVLSRTVVFGKAGAEPLRIGFRSSEFKLKEGDEVASSLFLCDDAKTYCVKKTLNFPLKVNSDLQQLLFKPGKETKPAKKLPQKKTKKDELGFWVNDFKSALKESMNTHRPLLIDFYGIWCPPCNLYNETVFPTQKFKTASRSFVLLKMDADDEGSFELKSHFKVGGYPTLVAVKTPAKEVISSLEELDRIVGFLPVEGMSSKLKHIADTKDQSLEERIQQSETSLATDLKRLIETKLEKKETEEALQLAEKGLNLRPSDLGFKILKLSAQTRMDSAKVKDGEIKAALQAVLKDRDQLDSTTLMHSIDLASTHAELMGAEFTREMGPLFDVLSKRLDPKTLMISDLELSIADLDVMKMDFFEAMKDEKGLQSARKAAIQSYEKLIGLHPKLDSRGLNLELAYLLYKNGDLEQAKKIYSRFIERFPKEFTFYFAASKMYLELKDLKTARDYAERAVQFAYGDNLIRSMDRLVRIMGAQGEKTFAVQRGKEFLTSLKSPEGLRVRTDRYIQQLKKTISEIETGKN